MLIQIVRNDNHYDYVKEFVLARLIEEEKIIKFRRLASGWVTLGAGQVRVSKSRTVFGGTERRTV
jgi:hypothetical protein